MSINGSRPVPRKKEYEYEAKSSQTAPQYDDHWQYQAGVHLLIRLKVIVGFPLNVTAMQPRKVMAVEAMKEVMNEKKTGQSKMR